MAVVNRLILDVCSEIYLEIKKANRTTTSLSEQGYARSHVQFCIPLLIEQEKIYKHGNGKTTYYSVEKTPIVSVDIFNKKVDPIVLPEVFINNAQLSFRMGYTDIIPQVHKIIKGKLHS